MNRMTKLLTLAVAAIVVTCVATPLFAQQCPTSQPAQHFGGKIANCPDDFPVAGFVGVVGNPAITSGTLDVICENGSQLNQQQVLCQGEAGVGGTGPGSGDGLVTFSFDWGNLPPPTGCPNAAGVPNVGRNFFEVVCNNGAGALITVAYDVGSTGYVVDFAHPYDPGTGFYDLVLAPNQNGLKLEQFSRAGGTDHSCINQTTQAVKLYSDCDPGSLATAFGVVCPDTTPAAGPGANIYTRSGPKNVKPLSLRTADWQLAGTTAGPNGSKCVDTPTPTAGNCTWIGSTSVVGGSDTGGISGWVEVCDQTASGDKVKINSAAFNQGKLAVDFSTENESLIVGFNVYAGSTKLNTGLIAAKGQGSNNYSFEVGRGAVKSNKTVTVEAVKSDGTVTKTAPVNLK